MLAKLSAVAAGSLLALASYASADAIDHEFAQWQHRSIDSDLFTFFTRPDLRPPRLKVVLNKKDRTPPGYIFVAPYDCLECSNLPATSHLTHQIGPLIYTQDGELIWSGTEVFQGTKVFDFKAVMINGEHHLSLVAPTDAAWSPFPDGFATVLNASYHPIFSVDTRELGQTIDMHEFNVLGDGQTALIGMVSRRNIGELDQAAWKGEIQDYSFTEFDLQTRQQFVNWTASEHVPLAESLNPAPNSEMPAPWDWFQMNSIDKDKFGNYLVSARATNTIYYVSPEGTVIWRLGGLNSSFKQDFNFSRQSHARIQDQNEVNMVISLFDNAADDTGKWNSTSETSGSLVVGLDLENMVASLYHKHERPDGGLTESNSGNIQFLPNGGVFSGWGENGFMSEYVNRGGEKLYEASFASRRFANYRAYKMEFVAQPTTKPITKSYVSTNACGQLRTAIYVSWNGATEVTTWKFHSHTPKDVVVGEMPKTGFETSFIAMDYHPVIFVEALDAFGNSLANSSLDVTEIPSGFHNTDDGIYGKAGDTGTVLAMRLAIAFVAGLFVANLWGRFRSSKGDLRRRAGSLRWNTKQKR